MGVKYAVCVDGEPIHVNPQLLSQRIVIVGMCKDDTHELFKHELAGRASSLFDAYGRMRVPVKPQLATALSNLGGPAIHHVPDFTSPPIFHVVDGGSLLYKVVLKKQQTFASIANAYVKIVKNHVKSLCGV